MFPKYNYTKELIKSKELVKDADAVLIVCGAGMSVESGIDTYRGTNGLWNKTIKIGANTYRYDEISSLDMFEKFPKLVWGFKGRFYDNIINNCKPHKGYYMLLDILKKKYKNNYFICTSNIDYFFERSGYDKDKIYEVHGSMKNIQCSSKKCSNSNGIYKFTDIILPKYDKKTFIAKSIPICSYCGLYLRPNVSMFGDIKFFGKPYLHQRRKMDKWINENIKRKKKIVILEIGCGINQHSLRLNNGKLMSGEWKIPKINKFVGIIRINPNDIEEQKNTYHIKSGATNGIKKIFL